MADLKHELSHVYWIGGSPCAGKTTLARKLVEQYDFTYYKCDDCYDDHMSRSDPENHPSMFKIRDLSWDEVWSVQFCSIPVEEQVEEVMTVYEEQFSLIVEDLLSLPKKSKILVEGAALLPDKVAPLLMDPKQAIWFVPAPEFQVNHFSKREWIDRILQKYDDPEKAFSNWMKRDMKFAEQISEQANRLSLKEVKVDGSHSIMQNFATIRSHFSLL
ncbi:hypothetical protein [Thalassobacillus pellis]|uniref:hypothetical protein n=1 Tax=Thalassobacillus pellis TaxID=748008 RepID=UPI001961427E|nr:hypothetical protein [Thalassobacillus pellis]MBM7551399.1 uridine kinase [Thalassobacillus pellis]